jgi:hypothetical protein
MDGKGGLAVTVSRMINKGSRKPRIILVTLIHGNNINLLLLLRYYSNSGERDLTESMKGQVGQRLSMSYPVKTRMFS